MSYVQRDAPPAHTGKGSGPRAGFWQRFGAAFIDGLILAIPYALLQIALKGAGVFLGLLVQVGYYTYLEGGPKGQTIGKQLLGIRVISFDDGGPIGYGRGFIRWIGRIVSGVVFLLGYLWMLWDPESQTWHDKFAGSVVVPVSAYPPPR